MTRHPFAGTARGRPRRLSLSEPASFETDNWVTGSCEKSTDLCRSDFRGAKYIHPRIKNRDGAQRKSVETLKNGWIAGALSERTRSNIWRLRRSDTMHFPIRAAKPPYRRMSLADSQSPTPASRRSRLGPVYLPISAVAPARSSAAGNGRDPGTPWRLNYVRKKVCWRAGRQYRIAPRSTESRPQGSTRAARQPSVRPQTPWSRTELDRKHNYLDPTEPN